MPLRRSNICIRPDHAMRARPRCPSGAKASRCVRAQPIAASLHAPRGCAHIHRRCYAPQRPMAAANKTPETALQPSTMSLASSRTLVTTPSVASRQQAHSCAALVVARAVAKSVDSSCWRAAASPFCSTLSPSLAAASRTARSPWSSGRERCASARRWRLLASESVGPTVKGWTATTVTICDGPAAPGDGGCGSRSGGGDTD